MSVARSQRIATRLILVVGPIILLTLTTAGVFYGYLQLSSTSVWPSTLESLPAESATVALYITDLARALSQAHQPAETTSSTNMGAGLLDP